MDVLILMCALGGALAGITLVSACIIIAVWAGRKHWGK